MKKKIKVLAIIPARGGSKAVKNKNLRSLAKIPLIAHSINFAKSSEKIDQIIVSTDSDKIAKIANYYGAHTPFLRPEEISQDHSTDYEAFAHALKEFENINNYLPDVVVHLRPTSPLRPTGVIDNCIKDFLKSPADSLRCVIECVGANTPYKMWSINENLQLNPLLKVKGIKEPFNHPRQFLPKTYLQVGTFDLVKPNTILEKKSMTGDAILPFIVEAKYGADIDDYEDLKQMRNLYKNIKS